MNTHFLHGFLIGARDDWYGMDQKPWQIASDFKEAIKNKIPRQERSADLLKTVDRFAAPYQEKR
jgi:hypothetical protein